MFDPEELQQRIVKTCLQKAYQTEQTAQSTPDFDRLLEKLASLTGASTTPDPSPDNR